MIPKIINKFIEYSKILEARKDALKKEQPPPTIVLTNYWTASNSVSFVEKWLKNMAVWEPLRKLLFNVSDLIFE